MSKHIKHHYLLSTFAVCIAFAGMLMLRKTTGYFAFEAGSFSKVIIAVIALMGLLIFFERGRNEQ